LPEVVAVPPPRLPKWIVEISPTKTAAPLAQIRVRFQEPLIPVERIDSPGQQEILKKFQLDPPLPGTFRFLTPRMVGFQADRALPLATQLRVILKAGLADLKGHQLAQDLAWSFQTDPIQLTGLPNTARIGTEPSFDIVANVELDLASTSEHLSLVSKSDDRAVPVAIALDEGSRSGRGLASTRPTDPRQEFDPSQQQWTYRVRPEQPLEKATPYRLRFEPGIWPAYGNLTSASPFSSDFSTYAPLAFQALEGIEGESGRFTNGSPLLSFNNGLDAESARQHISISPPPSDDQLPLMQTEDGLSTVAINPGVLAPQTDYTITIGADLRDEFGQTLGQPVTVDYSAGDLKGDLWAPDGFHIFPAGSDLQLHVASTNLPDGHFQAAYRTVQPVDLAYADYVSAGNSQADLLPLVSQWQPVAVANPKNQAAETLIPIRDRLGQANGVLAYGVQAKTYPYDCGNSGQCWAEPQYTGMVQLTNVGLTAQVFPETGWVQVNHLSDGTAVANARIEFYPSQLYKPVEQQVPKSRLRACATGETDERGTLQLSAIDLEGCMPAQTNRFANPPELLVVARDGDDWAFTRLREYDNYGYGVYLDWDGGTPPLARGTIFSDRQLYQPGEAAWFTAVAYHLDSGQLVRDRDTEFRVTISDPDGNSTPLGTYTANEFGTFSLKWTLADKQPLGFYSIQAKGKNGVELYGDFQVAEFKPPNFKVDLALDQKVVLPETTVKATLQSNYLFGPPVDGGKVEYFVTREQAFFAPKGWDEFQFGPQWFWPEAALVLSSDVLQKTASLDDAGHSSQSVTVGNDLPYPATYRVDAQVSDVSNLSVARSQSFTALPSDRLIGLKSAFVGTADEAFPVEVIVTDPDGKPVQGQRVRLALEEMRYSSVTRAIEGSETAENQVEYIPAAEVTIRSGDKPMVAELTAPTGGSYRIRANLAGEKGSATATDLQIWVTGDEAVYWGDRGNSLDIQLDKETYAVGETATALLQSPYEEAELYFSVVRHNTLNRQVRRVKGGAPQIQFEVTPDMLPNAAVQAVLVRQGQPLAGDEANSIDTLSRIGFVPFATDLKEKYLQVEVKPLQPALQPGEEQTLQLQLRDAGGQPVAGQFVVMAVNEAILQLSGYRPPDLVETVYAEQPIATRIADNRPDVALEPLAPPEPKGWGYGGGLSAGGGSTRVRTDFKPLAYYNGAVVTDAQGRAEVTFKLPDDLTTWRVMAVASDRDSRFGQGEATFTTTQPLLTNPILPQFARLGDTFDVGVAVTNTENAKGDLQIRGELTRGNPVPVAEGEASVSAELPLQFAEDSQPRSQIERNATAEPGTHAYRFSVVTGEVGQAQVKFATQLDTLTDAFAVPLEVKTLDPTEQVVETGVTADRVEIPLTVDRSVVPTVGGLEVNVASTLLPTVVASLQPALADEWLPFLEPAATRLSVATSLKQLQERYGRAIADVDLQQLANESLAALADLQQPDGGFASWPDADGSSYYLTPYAARSLARAQAAGLPVSEAMVRQVKAYLGQLLANPRGENKCSARDIDCVQRVQLDVLWAFAEWGENRSDYLSNLYEGRERFDIADRIRLARQLWLFPDWQAESRAIADEVRELVAETGRSATVNLPVGWRWLDSNAVAQSQLLQLSIAQNRDPESLDRLLRGLLALRKDGLWQNDYDTAEVLQALEAYGETQPTPPNFTATARLGERSLASIQLQGYDRTSADIDVAMADLPPGKSLLTLAKTGNGQLHYLAAYRYRLPGPQAGRLNGLRVTREIRPANQETVLRRIGLNAEAEPLAIAPGQVLDIGLEIVADHPVTHLTITDPLPAGFEAIDSSFQTSTPYFQSGEDSWEIGYQTVHRDRVVAYGDRLDPGVYTLHYLVRSVTPGTFLWPGAEVQLEYAPEEFGRSASSTVQVRRN
jgi:uncharacterized protein YfaS (alpha-2-macroglobulin family)